VRACSIVDTAVGWPWAWAWLGSCLVSLAPSWSGPGYGLLDGVSWGKRASVCLDLGMEVPYHSTCRPVLDLVNFGIVEDSTGAGSPSAGAGIQE
jgi:hypothetical protein